MKTKWIMAIFLALLLAVTMLGCGSDSDSGSETDGLSNTSNPDTIKIGVLLPFSGTLVCTGNYRKAAADLAVAEINANGQIFDKDLEIIAEDTETDPTKAAAAAQRLVDQGVIGIIGAAASSSTIKAAEDVTIDDKTLLIAPSSTSPMITDLTDNGLVWRTAPSDVYQGKVAADYAYNDLGIVNASILYVDNAYGEGLADSFGTEYETLGGTILNSVSYPEMDSSALAVYDFGTEVNTLFSESPDLIYLVTYALDGAKITLEAASHITNTYTPQVMGADGNYGSVFLSNADSDFVEGMIGTAPTAPEGSINYDKFAVNYKAMYDINPPPYTENTYDALYLMAYAMLAANSTISEDIAAELQAVSTGGEQVGVAEFAEAKAKILNGTDIDYEGASGSIEWDNKGDVTNGSYLVWQVTDGAFSSEKFVSFDQTGIINSASAITKPLLPVMGKSALCP